MAEKSHPTMHESSVVIGAALAFTLDQWELFSTEFAEGAADEFPNGMGQVRELMEHLLKDIGDMLITEKEMLEAMEFVSKVMTRHDHE